MLNSLLIDFSPSDNKNLVNLVHHLKLRHAFVEIWKNQSLKLNFKIKSSTSIFFYLNFFLLRHILWKNNVFSARQGLKIIWKTVISILSHDNSILFSRFIWFTFSNLGEMFQVSRNIPWQCILITYKNWINNILFTDSFTFSYG